MNKKNLKNSILLFIVILFGMSTGYSYLNSSLYINGTSIISASVFDINIDNLYISAGSVVAISEPIINDTTTTFSVKLENIDDFYEFTVDVVNSGNCDAKLGSLVETTGLTTEQEQYFDYNLTYQNNEPIEENQLVKKDESVRLKSRVEYKEEVNVSSVPESVKTLNLGFKLNYDLDEGTGISVKDNGIKVVPIANGNIDNIGTIVTIGTEQFYTIGTEENNVKLLSMYNLYVGNIVDEFDESVPIVNSTGMQDSTAIGYNYDFVNDVLLFPFIGVTAFSENSPNYNGSLVEGYVNDYKIKLKEIYDVNIIEARLITEDELISEEIGCSLDKIGTCEGAPSFIYSTSYWTSTEGESDRISYVDVNSDINNEFYFLSGRVGVRPVIIIPKQDFYVPESGVSKNMIDFFILETPVSKISYQAEYGMTWEKWVLSKYNTYGFYIEEDGCVCIDQSQVSGVFSSDIIEQDGLYSLIRYSPKPI